MSRSLKALAMAPEETSERLVQIAVEHTALARRLTARDLPDDEQVQMMARITELREEREQILDHINNSYKED